MERHNKNNIIGPITTDDWNILRDLKGSISYYTSYGITGFMPVIHKHKKIYKEYLSKYI